MRKGIYIVGVLMAVMTLGTGCGSSSSQEPAPSGNVETTDTQQTTDTQNQEEADNEEAVIDCDAMAQELIGLIAKQEPDDEMMLLDSELIRSNYDTISEDLYESAVCYLSSGATANEVAIFTCKDAESASLVEAELSKRVDSRTKSYEDYNPEEAQKLKNAIIAKNGKYAVLVVTADNEEAASLIQKY